MQRKWDEIISISKDEDFDKTINTLPKTKKIYKVSVADNPEFISKNLKNIAVGDTISIMANELVYKTNDLTAVKVISPFSSDGQGTSLPATGVKPQDIKSISGKVTQVADNSLTVEAIFLDPEKVKTQKAIDPKNPPTIKKSYKVTVNGNTDFSSKKLTDIKTGDIVSVFSDTPIFDTTDFVAVKVVALPGVSKQ